MIQRHFTIVNHSSLDLARVNIHDGAPGRPNGLLLLMLLAAIPMRRVFSWSATVLASAGLMLCTLAATPAKALPAGTQPACAGEAALLTDLENQLARALSALSTPQCDGPAKTVCEETFNELKQEVSGTKAYIGRGCPNPVEPPPPPTPLTCSTSQAPTNGTERIACTMTGPTTEVWRIDQPNVKQKQTNYPNIPLLAGDLVSVFAGGCVQTGGSGLTWKRYARPVSRLEGTDNEYFGLITIPGFGALRNVRDAIMAGGIPVTGAPGTSTSLTLGYSDDNYGDNGYWGHDDGLWQQCNDLPNAWIVIAIQHNCSGGASGCLHGRALDFATSTVDVNGFPENPSYVWTRLVGSDPNPKDVCSWSSKTGTNKADDATLCATVSSRDSEWYCVQGTTPGAIAGHMNWTQGPVTFSGQIASPSYDPNDSEYTFDMTSVAHSLFVTTQSFPQVEFDTRETIDKVPSAKQGLETVLHTKSLQGADAIITGVAGQDCGHSCNTEWHPALAFFVHTKADTQDDTWVFFVKNFGNEGFCGSQEIEATMQDYTARLPEAFATDVALANGTIVAATNSVGANGFSYSKDPNGGGAFFHFSLPPASQKGVILGELHLRWTIVPQKINWERLWTKALETGVNRSAMATAARGSSAQKVTALQSMISARVARARPTQLIADADSTEEEVLSALQHQPKAVQDATNQALSRFNALTAQPTHVLTGTLDPNLGRVVPPRVTMSLGGPSHSDAEIALFAKMMKMLLNESPKK